MYGSKILNRIKLYCFLKSVAHELNSEMVKSGMVLLTEREKINVSVGWKLQSAAGNIVDERERKLMWHG
jgi:hypothetical protein